MLTVTVAAILTILGQSPLVTVSLVQEAHTLDRLCDQLVAATDVHERETTLSKIIEHGPSSVEPLLQALDVRFENTAEAFLGSRAFKNLVKLADRVMALEALRIDAHEAITLLSGTDGRAPSQSARDASVERIRKLVNAWSSPDRVTNNPILRRRLEDLQWSMRVRARLKLEAPPYRHLVLLPDWAFTIEPQADHFTIRTMAVDPERQRILLNQDRIEAQNMSAFGFCPGPPSVYPSGAEREALETVTSVCRLFGEEVIRWDSRLYYATWLVSTHAQQPMSAALERMANGDHPLLHLLAVTARHLGWPGQACRVSMLPSNPKRDADLAEWCVTNATIVALILPGSNKSLAVRDSENGLWLVLEE
jgi:hypothetical protein